VSKIIIPVIIALSFAGIGPSFAEDTCDAALVRATYNLSNQVGIDWRLADLVTQESYDQIRNSAGANAVIYGVPVGANYSDFRNRVDTLKKEHRESLTYTQQINISWSGLYPKSENTYRDCLYAQVLNNAGLHAVVLGATQRDITILIRWNVPGAIRTSVTWAGLTKQLRSLFPSSLSQGDLTVIVPRPNQQMSIAGNAPGYTTKQIVLEPLPPPAPDITPKWISYTFPNVITRDGDGNGVGNLADITFSMLVDPSVASEKVPYKFQYSYYNGSGTWRGSQTIFVQLLDANQRIVDTVSFGLDRGHCVYGHTEPRGPFQGTTTEIDSNSVKAIKVQTNSVSGVQTPC
jgi:hypothetical protein